MRDGFAGWAISVRSHALYCRAHILMCQKQVKPSLAMTDLEKREASIVLHTTVCQHNSLSVSSQCDFHYHEGDTCMTVSVLRVAGKIVSPIKF